MVILLMAVIVQLFNLASVLMVVLLIAVIVQLQFSSFAIRNILRL